YALGDFADFVPQDRTTGEAIRDHLMAAQKYGLRKIAIVSGSPLVKMQYKRLSQGVEVEFFDEKTEALAWLRGHE
ncbi:MAG: STAS/SEC14 domain-containing protein, partial [Pseudomonadota bacterium]